MTPTPEVQERIRRYLLGQLTDGARQEFEQELLVDEELFVELLVVEDELNDEYLGGELPHGERVRFEQHFLAAPERQEKLRFARALNRYVTTASRQETSAGEFSSVSEFSSASRSSRTVLYRAAAVLAVLILIIGTLWFFRQRSSSPETFATISLTISQSTRGEGVPAPKVRLSDDALKIVLRLPDQSPTTTRYRVELESDNGQSKSLEAIAQEAQSVTVVIPAGELRRGLYSLKVSTVSAEGGERRLNGSYFFTVE